MPVVVFLSGTQAEDRFIGALRQGLNDSLA
jgi:hypothetical protein